jgi:hypothetical protein
VCMNIFACFGQLLEDSLDATLFIAFSESSVLALIRMSLCFQSYDYCCFYDSIVEMRFYIGDVL